MIEKALKYYPIKVLLVFLVITEVLFYFGPIKYSIQTPFTLAFFFAVCNFALYFGYKKGVDRFSPSVCTISFSLIKVFLLFGLALNIKYLITKWALHGLDFSFKSLMLALTNPGQAYRGEALSDIHVDVFTGILLSPLQWSAIPLGICYWKKLTKFYKIVVCLTAIVYLLTWLGIGTRKGLLDLILTTYFLSIASNITLFTDDLKRKKIYIALLILSSAFLTFFIYSNLSRVGIENYTDFIDVREREYNSMWLTLPSGILSTLSEITDYLCGGYNSLSIAISEIGVIPVTFGGSSMSLWNYLDRFFGYNVIPYTYMQILQSSYGIHMYECWHSIYLWLANDFTFFGVPIIIYIIGRVFSHTWLDCIAHENSMAYPMCMFMLIMVFYFFANNQVLSFQLEPFIGCSFLYLFFRKKLV